MELSVTTHIDDSSPEEVVKLWKLRVGQMLLMPSYDCLSDLEADWDEFQQMYFDDQLESDLKSSELFGKINRDRYIEMRSVFLKDDIEDTLLTDYDPFQPVRESAFELLFEDSIVDATETIYVEPEVPFFTPAEMIKLGVSYTTKGFYSDKPDMATISEKNVKTWFKEYCNKFRGFKNESYIPSFEWANTLNTLVSDIDTLSGDELLNRKQSILDLGWNPEIPFNDKNKKYARERIKKSINNVSVVRYDRALKVEESAIESTNFIDIALYGKRNGRYTSIGLVMENGKVVYYNTTAHEMQRYSIQNEDAKIMRLNVSKETKNKILVSYRECKFDIPYNTEIVSPSVVVNSFVESLLKSAHMYNSGEKKMYLVHEGIVNETLNIVDANFTYLPILEVKDLPVEFDDDGNLLISKGKNIDFEGEYSRCHLALKQYQTAKAIDGMKYCMTKLWYMNIILEESIHSTKSKPKLKKLNTVRAKIMGDIKTYLPIILKLDPKFDILKEYNNSPFSENKLRIKHSTIKYTVELFKRLISLI